MEQSRARHAVAPVQAINGWPIPTIFSLDEQRPGTALRIFSAKGFMRQVLFFVLAEIQLQGAEDVATRLSTSEDALEHPIRVVAEAISSLDARELLEALVGCIPDGMIGCLRKAGDAPLYPNAYRLIVAHLTDGEAPERGRTLRQLDRVTSGALEALAVIDPVFCRPDWIAATSAKTAAALNIVLEMARVYCDADDDAILNSITADGPKRPSDWANRWADKAARFPLKSPITSTDFEALTSAEEMRRAGIEMGNCLKSKIMTSFIGRALYLVHRPKSAIIEIVPLSEGRWQVRGIYGKMNTALPTRTAAEILGALTDEGLLCSATVTEYRRLQAVGSLTGCWDHKPCINLSNDFDDEDFYDD